jgi:hypothetical protein
VNYEILATSLGKPWRGKTIVFSVFGKEELFPKNGRVDRRIVLNIKAKGSNTYTAF